VSSIVLIILFVDLSCLSEIQATKRDLSSRIDQSSHKFDDLFTMSATTKDEV